MNHVDATWHTRQDKGMKRSTTHG